MTVSMHTSNSGNLHETVLEIIGRGIVTGEYEPNQTLSMDTLGQLTGTSRAVLREVFRVLQSMGLITARPKVGTKVAPRSWWNYLDPQVIRWRLESGDQEAQVNELFSLRLAVEPVASCLLAAAGSESTTADLDRQIDLMTTAYANRDLHSFATADVGFHLAIIDSCGNEMFRTLGSAISAAIRTRETLYFPLNDALLRGLDLHRQLVAEIRSGNYQLEHTSRKLIVDSQRETNAIIGQRLRRG